MATVDAAASPHRRPDRSAAALTLDSLTSLRFFAALAVVLFHSELLLAGILPADRAFSRVVFAGPTGVSFFFILSGFVLAWSARADDTARSFYRRRAARILPNHVVAWSFALLVLITCFSAPGPWDAISSLLLLNSWYPSPSMFNAVNTPSWSLCCETVFYACFPVIYWLLRRATWTLRRAGLLASLGAIIALALLSPQIDQHLRPGAAGFFVYHFPASRLFEFIIGIVLALEVRGGRWRMTALWPSAVAVGAGIALVDLTEEQRFYVVLTLVPFAALIASTAARDRAGLPSPLTRRRAIMAGQRSFALYIVHWPVLLLYAHFVPGPLNPLAGVLVVLAAIVTSLLVASGLFELWERPLERRLRVSHQLPAVTRPLVPDEAAR